MAFKPDWYQDHSCEIQSADGEYFYMRLDLPHANEEQSKFVICAERDSEAYRLFHLVISALDTITMKDLGDGNHTS